MRETSAAGIFSVAGRIRMALAAELVPPPRPSGGGFFREIRRGDDRRRYIWIHGNEHTAREVLRDHIRRYDGRAFLIDNDVRNVRLNGGQLDPNRMFSREGAERNLRTLNPAWDKPQIRIGARSARRWSSKIPTTGLAPKARGTHRRSA